MTETENGGVPEDGTLLFFSDDPRDPGETVMYRGQNSRASQTDAASSGATQGDGGLGSRAPNEVTEVTGSDHTVLVPSASSKDLELATHLEQSLLGQPIVDGTSPLLADRAGEYTLHNVLGRGGQGEVWSAVQVYLGRNIAVKRAIGSIESQLNFYKEAFTTAQLDHPNIVPIYDLGMIEVAGVRSPMLAMKRIGGKSWRAIMNDDRAAEPFDYDDFLRRHLGIFLQVSNAVSYAHSRRIIHRDLKPSQVMLGEFGEVYLLDWGLAVYLGEAGHVAVSGDFAETVAREAERASATDSAQGSVLDANRIFNLDTATNPAGTPVYMAPEQAMPTNAGLGVHTDIYLLGGLLYDIVAGRPPRDSGSIYYAIIQAQQNKFDELPENVPPELRDIILQCLRANPEERPATAQDVRDAVAEYLSGAGRKAESLKITTELGQLSFAGMDYAGLSRFARQLNSAASLWPENPDVVPLQDDLYAAYVHAALSREDFVLAQVQAGRLQNEERGAVLRTQVADERAAAERALPDPEVFTGKRVGLLVASVVAIVAMVLALVFAARSLLLTELDNKLRTLAVLAARDVNPQDLEAIDKTQAIEAPEFQTAYNRLNLYRFANADIRHIYALFPNTSDPEGTWRVVLDGDPYSLDVDDTGAVEPPEEGKMPGATFGQGTPLMVKAFRDAVPVSGLQSSVRGEFVSGFAPIIDPNSRTVKGLLGLNVRMESVRAKLMGVNLAGIAAAVLLIVIVFVALRATFISRGALQKVRDLQRRIEKQNLELQGSDIYLG